MLLCCCLLLFVIATGRAQLLDYSSNKEKLYIHTNHVFYKPGETLFFKLYLVNAAWQTPSFISQVAYVEIINPSGNVLEKMNYQVINGAVEGSFDFGEQLPGGVYKLRGYTTWMQNETDSLFFTKEITLQAVLAPRVLMKLDFPRKGYGAGEEVSADFSIRSLNDRPIKKHHAAFTVSLAGKVVHTGNFSTNHEGKAKVTFTLPTPLTTHDGLLNITVQYDAFTEAISRSIPLVLNKIDLQWMPEGGTWVAGLPNWVAFKALNENGKPADVKGVILDETGQVVTHFESYQFGMGKVLLEPKPGKSYSASINSPAGITATYPLPMATMSGVVMNFYRADGQWMVKLNSNVADSFKLVGQSHDQTFYQQTLWLANESHSIPINTDTFPAGIAQFTLYNSSGSPLAERLVFMQENKLLHISIKTDKQQYLPREKVKLNISTHNEQGKPVPANLSLSVLDDKLWTFADDKQHHILSWLLLGSELRGKVEEPPFYFKKDEPKALPALDLVMLTNGYRYFAYIDYVRQEQQLKYTPDETKLLSGVITDAAKKPVKATVYLINAHYNTKDVKQFVTAPDGLFYFSNMQASQYYYVVAKPLNTMQQVRINIMQNGLGHNPVPATMAALTGGEKRGFVVTKKTIHQPVLKADPAAAKEMVFQPVDMLGRANNLSEVVVTGYNTISKKSLSYSVTVTRFKQLEDMATNNFNNALQGKVPGLQITSQTNPGAATHIRLRGVSSLSGNNEPLYVVNGEVVNRNGLGINVDDIESVSVLKDGAASALYGSQAANGAIVIQTKKIRANGRSKNIVLPQPSCATQLLVASAPQFTIARQFYAPLYQSLLTPERNDFRDAIYWNPTVQTDKAGKASLEFYNSDATTTFRAIAEGIGWNGLAGRTEVTYAAENALSVDAKIPPYLTVGDKALLPLVIKNNTNDKLDCYISLGLPAKMKAGKYQENITLSAGQSQQVLVPVEALAAVKGNIRFVVGCGVASETVSLPISAAEKGFPVVQTFSGNASRTHTFTAQDIVPGTMQSELKLFKDVEGQLLNGIESMLREPYGCFEQTSSTTYPNVFVLQYLKASGKASPAIEQKAMNYIQRGYERLVGFETAENGFEWFGKTPPHEALTAYGLLEFTDMQDFVKVDKAMLARTKAYLLGRRDGNGYFKLATGGYDRFASVPNKIAHVYIVYALAKAGVGSEIQKEYKTALQEVLGSKDAYLTAMMALTAAYLHQAADFSRLLAILKELYTKKDLAAVTSVVNSRDASLRVETKALFALALMQEKQPDLPLIAQLISDILGEKSYYGYGSTQATVLALDAVVQLSKLAGKINEGNQITLLLNKQRVEAGVVAPNFINDGANSFEVAYSKAATGVPYSLEVAYSQFTPPTSEKAALSIRTSLSTPVATMGETVRLQVDLTNTKDELQPMAIAKLGIPAGLSAQPWQLKEMMEKNQVAYYEIFDNYLVLYWMGFAKGETKTIQLDLKAEVPGTYRGKASNVYLYYTPEHKYWQAGLQVEIKAN